MGDKLDDATVVDDVDLVARLQVILLPQLGRDHHPSLAGDLGFHESLLRHTSIDVSTIQWVVSWAVLLAKGGRPLGDPPKNVGIPSSRELNALCPLRFKLTDEHSV